MVRHSRETRNAAQLRSPLKSQEYSGYIAIVGWLLLGGRLSRTRHIYGTRLLASPATLPLAADTQGSLRSSILDGCWKGIKRGGTDTPVTVCNTETVMRRSTWSLRVTCGAGDRCSTEKSAEYKRQGNNAGCVSGTCKCPCYPVISTLYTDYDEYSEYSVFR